MNFLPNLKQIWSTNIIRPLGAKSSLYFAILIIYLAIKRANSATDHVTDREENTPGRFQVASFNFEHVSNPYAITLWILLGSLAKIGFHLSHKLTEKFPESCLLIILGLIVGGLFYGTKVANVKDYGLDSETFFLYLLPPIILEAGYFMPNRPFFSNIGTILLFAIVNTLFNTLLIGVTLWGFNFTGFYNGTNFGVLDCFVFAALISAVDPVAVLATFVEIQVNDMLYIIVFGESLLNDAVSVVLYRMFAAFSEMGDNLQPVDYALGATSFLVVALGGTFIGIIFGIIASYTTKFTEHTPVLEPLIIISIAYLSYLTAEMTSTSGILAITFCGMFMKQYVEFNISKKSSATIEYALKMFASIMETIIFMFMGLSTISDNLSWNTGFVLITIAACTIYRAIGVFIFATIANRWRLMELSITDMLIMSYGGIRGAVAFALALVLDEEKIPRKKEFVTATIAVVFFTVFIQGTTIGPVVKYLKVKRKEIEEPTMSAKLSNRLIDHTMSGLEIIAGVGGNHSTRNKIRSYDKRFLKPILIRGKFKSEDEKLLNTFKKINELNMNKMVDTTEYKIVKKEENNEKEIEQKQPEIKSILNKKSQSQNKFHELLENAMISPRRQTIVFDDELDDALKNKRKPSRSYSILSVTKRRKSLGALRYADNDLSSTVNENDLVTNWGSINRRSLTSITDEDETNDISLNSGKKSARSKSVPRSSSPNYDYEIKF